jgi:hypothetical protein
MHQRLRFSLLIGLSYPHLEHRGRGKEERTTCPHLGQAMPVGSFCVHAERDDAEITGCYFLAHPVNVEETDAAFDGSMLNVEIPFKVPIKGKRIDIREGTLDIGQTDPRKIEMREGKKSLGVGTY